MKVHWEIHLSFSFHLIQLKLHWKLQELSLHRMMSKKYCWFSACLFEIPSNLDTFLQFLIQQRVSILSKRQGDGGLRIRKVVWSCPSFWLQHWWVVVSCQILHMMEVCQIFQNVWWLTITQSHGFEGFERGRKGRARWWMVGYYGINVFRCVLYWMIYLFFQLVFTWMIGRWFVLAGLMLTPDNIEICLAQMHTQTVHIDSIHKNVLIELNLSPVQLIANPVNRLHPLR